MRRSATIGGVVVALVVGGAASGFASSMTDTQVAALMNYLRARFTSHAPWSDLAKTIEDARRTQTVFLQTSPGPRNMPTDPAQRGKP